MTHWNTVQFNLPEKDQAWPKPPPLPRVHMFTFPFFPPPRDAASRRALQAAIQQLAEAQPEATAKNLLHSLQSSGIGSKAGVPR